jgi:mRNA interferase RelE/StbE
VKAAIFLLGNAIYSGYNVARMRFEIVLAPEAIDDLQSLKANVRAAVRDTIEQHLRHEPRKTSKSRIKRLRGLSRPQYRLRVDEIRVYYDVTGEQVEILAIVPKVESEEWLRRRGEADETDSTFRDEG